MIKINNVSFTYGADNKAVSGGLKNINLEIPDGQVAVLCGESGCGKTTLSRVINGLIPHFFEGDLCGNAEVCGLDVTSAPLYETAGIVGSVFQNPKSQFFNVDTTSEITFGCENLGVPPYEIKERLHRTVSSFKMEKLLGRNIFALSGGEKQKIACAGAFIMQPSVFVLDEPSANLDSDSVEDLRNTIAYWKSLGKTVVISEHRLYYLNGIADRFIFMKDGCVAGDFTSKEFAALSSTERMNLGLRALSLQEINPSEAKPFKNDFALLKDFRFAYKGGSEKLKIDNCKIPYGGNVGIIGKNGAGKSTFSRCFCGLERKCGQAVLGEKTYSPKDRLNTCYMVMQDVTHQLFTETALDEVMISMPDENEERAKQILSLLDLSDYAQRHPMSLSGGQKQRVAIASAYASERSVIFLDEPTSGLDFKHMLEVADILKELNKSGKTVYVITHAPELICAACTDILQIDEGSDADIYKTDSVGIEKLKKFFGICNNATHET